MVFATVLLLIGPAVANDPPLPARLSETGLYVPGTLDIAAENAAYTPQYPLWTDGAAKRRWLYLPPGTAIDAGNPDAWEFPVGTKLWKEFGYSRPVETRFIERLPDGSWRFSAYAWNADGSDAFLADDAGARLHVQDAPRKRYEIPSRDDCRACHEAAPVPVLGATALQLSPARDRHPLHAQAEAAQGLDLAGLEARGWLKNLPRALHESPPRIDTGDRTRAVLGYLHGNCGHCHNDSGPLASLDLSLLQSAADTDRSRQRTLATLIGHASDTPLDELSVRVVPGQPDHSVLLARLHASNPYTRMPPLGSSVAHAQATELVRAWIEHDISPEDISQ